MFKSLSDVIKSFNTGRNTSSKGQAFQKDSFDFLKLIEAWPEIVGERLANHTIPLKNSNGYLTILTNHSAFSQQLSFMDEVLKKKIIEKFPSLTGKLKKIMFQTNTTHFEQKIEVVQKKKLLTKKAASMPHKYSPAYKKLHAEALEQFSDIEDQDLKEQFISIYIQQKHKS